MPSFVTVETPSTSTVTLEDTVTVVEVNGRGIGEAPVDDKYYARRNEAWYETGKFDEAPSDGNQYARQNADWSVVSVPDGGIPEAPENGIKYGRMDAGWSAITEGFADAPANNTTFGRNNNNWVEVTSGGGGIPEAPTDGQTYGRNNASWSVVTSGGGGKGGNIGLSGQSGTAYADAFDDGGGKDEITRTGQGGLAGLAIKGGAATVTVYNLASQSARFKPGRSVAGVDYTLVNS